MQERRILESWKEISDYLKRSIKTCRRWENELGLPIHRLDGTPSARVFAYPDELDQWMEQKLNHVKGEARGRGLFWSRKRKRLVIASGALIVLGVIAFLAWPLLFPRPAPVPSNNPVLAILPFDNLAGDEVLEDWRTAYPDLLITDLRQSRYVNVVPISRTSICLNDLKLDAAKAFGGEDLARIAEKTEADFITTGSLLRSGEDIVVNLFVHDLRSKDSAKNLRASLRGEQALMDKADDLTKEIKRALNLTPRKIACDIDERVYRIATKSPEAFKFFSQASHMWAREHNPNLVPTLQRAIDLDSKFALAYLALYGAYDRDHIEDMISCYQKAVALSDRLSERDRLHLQVGFDLFYKFQRGYKKLTEADIPASTIERLGQKETKEILTILEKLNVLYPGFSGDYWALLNLAKIYRDTEEWDEAIAHIEKAMVAPQRMIHLSWILFDCYRAKGQTDKAEKLLEDLCSSVPIPDGQDNHYRHLLAWDRRNYDEVLNLIKKNWASQDSAFPYLYFSGVGVVHWLKDDLAAAEKAYRTVVDPNNLHEEYQRSVDLAALSLSKGQIGQAVGFVRRGLELIDQIGEYAAAQWRGKAIHFHLANFYRLLGRLPEALDEAEIACRDYENQDIPAGLAVKLLHLRALITLEMGRLEEFERLLNEIKKFSEKVCYPKLMRAYFHLLGLRELRENRGHKAIVHFRRALDLSTPWTRNSDRAICLYNLAEAYDMVGSPSISIRYFEEIGTLAERESFSGDIYARSFYRLAKLFEHSWNRFPFPDNPSRTIAAENYRKFLSLWGDADPIFPEVAYAKARLAALEAE